MEPMSDRELAMEGPSWEDCESASAWLARFEAALAEGLHDAGFRRIHTIKPVGDML